MTSQDKRKKLTVNEMVRPFKAGEDVVIAIRSYFRGLPHSRYNGVGGKIVEKKGNCYVVRIMDQKAMKELIVNPVHIAKAKTKSKK